MSSNIKYNSMNCNRKYYCETCKISVPYNNKEITIHNKSQKHLTLINKNKKFEYLKKKHNSLNKSNTELTQNKSNNLFSNILNSIVKDTSIIKKEDKTTCNSLINIKTNNNNNNNTTTTIGNNNNELLKDNTIKNCKNQKDLFDDIKNEFLNNNEDLKLNESKEEIENTSNISKTQSEIEFEKIKNKELKKEKLAHKAVEINNVQYINNNNNNNINLNCKSVSSKSSSNLYSSSSSNIASNNSIIKKSNLVEIVDYSESSNSINDLENNLFGTTNSDNSITSENYTKINDKKNKKIRFRKIIS